MRPNTLRELMHMNVRKGQIMRYATMVVVLLLAVCVLLGAQCGTDDEVVKIMRDDFLSRAVSDAVRAATGLWADRLHWNVWIVPPAQDPEFRRVLEGHTVRIRQEDHYRMVESSKRCGHQSLSRDIFDFGG